MPTLPYPLIVPWIRLDQDARAEEQAALARARQPWLAGFCLFGGEAEQVHRLTARLRHEARRPLFIASDMERGAGQQVRGLRVLPDAGVWGLGASLADAEAFGETTAVDARSVGVDVLFAPVLDVRSEPRNPIVGNRSFGWDPDRVAALGAAFVRGALRGGAAPTAKHWPGHGATLKDSHDAVPVVTDAEERLVARDLVPFAAAFESLCPAAMTAHCAYPALDPTGAIATFSRPLVDRLRSLVAENARVTVFTDALLMAGALGDGGETAAARRSLRAGCDALLIPSDPERLAAELLEGADAALLADAERAAGGIQFLLRVLGRLASASQDGDPVRDAVPAEVAERAVLLAGGGDARPLGEGDEVLVVDDDDTSDRGLVLEARGARAGVKVHVVRVKRGAPAPAIPGKAKPTTVIVIGSVRAWKGSDNVSTGSLEVVGAALALDPSAQTIWLSPRPGPAAVLHLPGAGPDVEAALADCLFGEEE